MSGFDIKTIKKMFGIKTEEQNAGGATLTGQKSESEAAAQLKIKKAGIGLAVGLLAIAFVMTADNKPREKAVNMEESDINFASGQNTARIYEQVVDQRIADLETQLRSVAKSMEEGKKKEDTTSAKRLERMMQKVIAESDSKKQYDDRIKILERKLAEATEALENAQANPGQTQAPVAPIATGADDFMKQYVNKDKEPPSIVKGVMGSDGRDVVEPVEPVRVRGGAATVAPEEPVRMARRSGFSVKSSRNGAVSAETGSEVAAASQEKGSVMTASNSNARKQNRLMFPPGTTFTGVFLTGFDAITGANAKANPVPAVVRIKQVSRLPNMREADFRECYLIASGWGSASTKKANMRSERLSCMLPDGRIIDEEIQSFAIGPDGKDGIKGRLVSHNKELIAQSMEAKFYESVAQMFESTPVPVISTSPAGTTQYQSQDIAAAMQNGVLRGAGASLKTVSDFLMRQAEEMQSFVEIEAGTEVTFITVNGFSVTPKGDDYQPSKPVVMASTTQTAQMPQAR